MIPQIRTLSIPNHYFLIFESEVFIFDKAVFLIFSTAFLKSDFFKSPIIFLLEEVFFTLIFI